MPLSHLGNHIIQFIIVFVCHIGERPRKQNNLAKRMQWNEGIQVFLDVSHVFPHAVRLWFWKRAGAVVGITARIVARLLVIKLQVPIAIQISAEKGAIFVVCGIFVRISAKSNILLFYNKTSTNRMLSILKRWLKLWSSSWLILLYICTLYVICTIYGVLLCSYVLCFYELLQKVTRSTTTTRTRTRTTTFKLIERDARVENKRSNTLRPS